MGGTGGSSGTGGGGSGFGGTGGTSGTGGTGVPPIFSLIDDFEDGDFNTLNNDGRHGTWYSSPLGSNTDGNLSLSTVLVARGASRRALLADYNFVSQFDTGVSCSLNARSPMERTPYNASAYTGIRFTARARSASAPRTTIYVWLPDIFSDEQSAQCEIGGCGNHFGCTVEVSDQWQSYGCDFSKLKQLKGGGPPRENGVDAARLYAVKWTWLEASLQFWLDDVGFY